MHTRTGSLAVINVFTPKPGSLEDFLSEQFAAHRTKIQPYLERAEPGRYELVYEAGDL